MVLFGRYDYDPKKDLIGKGGFSRVYRAYDKKFQRLVALKIYKSGEISERYSPIAEIKRVIQMDHPNISRYIDIEEIEEEDSFGQTEKTQVCVMELLEGGNLHMYYALNRNLTIFRKLLKDVLEGLAYLHANGIIHRDIKPANILIKQSNGEIPVAKITDFGISKNSSALSDSTSSGLIVSVPYMAPEQLSPAKYGIEEKVHYNIDLWALGVMVYEVLTNDILFKNHDTDTAEQIMANILTNDPPEKIKKLPAPYNEIVSRCLVKNANERVKKAEELIALLDEVDKVDNGSGQIENVAPVLPVNNISSPTTSDSDADDTRILPAINTTVSNSDETKLISIPNADLPDPVRKPKQDDSASNTTDTTKIDKEQTNVTLFNRYRYNPLTDMIGKGGFSRVYKASDLKLGRQVALKIYKTSEYSDKYSPISEIRRVVNLDHPNICRYLDIEEIEKLNPFGEIEKIQVCVMELLDSGNFSEYFNASGKNIDSFKKLLQDVLHGIAYLHKNGIIHRDIKPANILIKKTIEGPVAKITDFGISKVSDSVNNHTSSALIVSIPYMAPEQLNIKKYGINESISFNLDLWSLGVTIYEIITGNVLFKNSDLDSSEQIMANIMAPELPEKIKELPQPFRNIVAHCIVKNANERAKKAEELLVLLNSSITEDPAKETYQIEPGSTESVTQQLPGINETKQDAEISPLPQPDFSAADSDFETEKIKEKDVAPFSKEPAALITEQPVAKKELPREKKTEPSKNIEKEPVKKQPEPAPVKDKPADPIARRKVLIAEPAPEVEKRARKQLNVLKISIAAALLIFIIALAFYFSGSRQEPSPVVLVKDTLVSTPAPVDSVHVKAPMPKTDTPVVTEVINVSKDKNQVTKKDSIKKSTSFVSAKEVDVKFSPSAPGTINKNGEFYFKSDGLQEVHSLMEGLYIFELIKTDGSKITRKIEVSRKFAKKGLQFVKL